MRHPCHRLNLFIVNSVLIFKALRGYEQHHRILNEFTPSGFHCCDRVSSNDCTYGFFCVPACKRSRELLFPPPSTFARKENKKKGVRYSQSQYSYKFFPLKQLFCGSIFLSFQLIGKRLVDTRSLLVCESPYIT